MNSLVGYESDDDYEETLNEKQTDSQSAMVSSSSTMSASTKRFNNKMKLNANDDVNYEEVQMDLSEESNESRPKSDERESSSKRDRERHKDSRERSNKDRDNRDRYNRRERDRDHERGSRSTRSPSRERRRSRSSSRRSNDRNISRYSRSRSRERNRSSRYGNSSNYRRYEKDRPGNRTERDRDRQERINEHQKLPDNTAGTVEDKKDDRFFMPGITGRFRDQIERRKLLWQKKDTTAAAAATATTTQRKPVADTSKTMKVWETTTFAQDTDGKVASKFKRLMGIKGTTGAKDPAVDVLKKQEEMFSSMEQQYEVARTATHTMRGVGLGFSSSYQR